MAQLFGMARLGRDVEVRYTQSGEAVASLSLAFEYGKKGRDGKRPTQWGEGSLWGQRAEALAPYLLKGSRFSVTMDDVHIETFSRPDGTEGHKLVGRVSNLEFGGAAQRPPQQNQYAAQRDGQAPRVATSLTDMEDDITF
ncbi:single-stranded DNA-binding protein [Bordetella avium]|uniref:single-stranded DNA-binding protein n=1 Tax=Bordetella avium TaxID=521 RepID=UPI0039FD7C3E